MGLFSEDWSKVAMAPGVNREKREFCDFCDLAFDKVDIDEDGFINHVKSDCVLEIGGGGVSRRSGREHTQ